MASYGSSEQLSVVLSEEVEDTSVKEKQTSKFPLLIEKVNHRTKIKWQGDLTSLQHFVGNILNLEGSWSFTSNNGGFHVFKSESLTICFYPGTKTLNVQGAKQEVVRELILKFAKSGNNSNPTEHVVSENGGHFGNEIDNNIEANVELTDESCLINTPDQPQIFAHEPCSRCQNNSRSIAELWQKFSAFESNVVGKKASNVDCITCQHHARRIKDLEEERDSLLAVIKLLGQDIQTSNPNNHPHENESPWTKVKHNKKAKSNRTDHGNNTVSATHEATQNLLNVQQNNNTGIRQPSGTRDTKINRNHTKDFRSSHQPTEAGTKKHVALVGDSMTKPINGRKLSKSIRVTSHSFPGATLEDLADYVKPVLKRKPDHVIIHAGTNNLRNDSPRQIKEKMSKVIDGIKQEDPTVGITISSVINWTDKPLNNKILQVNQLLEEYCNANNFDFIMNNNINSNSLNAGGLHLNPKGIQTLAANLRNYITY